MTPQELLTAWRDDVKDRDNDARDVFNGWDLPGIEDRIAFSNNDIRLLYLYVNRVIEQLAGHSSGAP